MTKVEPKIDPIILASRVDSGERLLRFAEVRGFSVAPAAVITVDLGFTLEAQIDQRMAQRAPTTIAPSHVFGFIHFNDFSWFHRAATPRRLRSQLALMTNLNMCLIVANSALSTGVAIKGTTMAKVSLQSVYNISPDQIWALIGKVNALPDWHPAIQAAGGKMIARYADCCWAAAK